MARYSSATKAAIAQVKQHKAKIQEFVANQLCAHHNGIFGGIKLDTLKGVMQAGELNEEIDKVTWYSSIDENGIDAPDYSIYDDYLLNGYYCWCGWTHKNVLDTVGFLHEIGYTPTRILDFGAGIGTSTVELALAYPNAKIVYSNIGSLQIDMAKRLAKHMGVTNIIFTHENDFAAMRECDVVVAYEVFEHIREPISIVQQAILDGKCRVLVDNSSFTIRAPGHFPSYVSPTGKVIPNKKFRRTFNKAIRTAGFASAEKVLAEWPRSFWNNRPAVFVRGMQ